jgi:hypothetical protein
MTPFLSTLTLRTALLVDAGTCALMGALLCAGAGPIADLTGIAPTLLTAAGLLLFPIAAFMLFLVTRVSVPPTGAALVIAGNALWVAGSLVLLVPEISGANAVGIAFLAAQALAVSAFAWLEFVTLNSRLRPA